MRVDRNRPVAVVGLRHGWWRIVGSQVNHGPFYYSVGYSIRGLTVWLRRLGRRDIEEADFRWFDGIILREDEC